MSRFGKKLVELAKLESREKFRLKELLVFNSKRFEVSLYSEYQPMCNPDLAYIDGKGYRLADGCSNELFTDDRTLCAIYYDKLGVMKEGHTVESFQDPLSFIRKIANSKFLEIWDDEDEKDEIYRVIRMAEAIGEKIEKHQILIKE